jgi:hypothetical protein
VVALQQIGYAIWHDSRAPNSSVAGSWRRLEGKPDWGQIEDLCDDVYRSLAPKRLVALLDEGD